MFFSTAGSHGALIVEIVLVFIVRAVLIDFVVVLIVILGVARNQNSSRNRPFEDSNTCIWNSNSHSAKVLVITEIKVVADIVVKSTASNSKYCTSGSRSGSPGSFSSNNTVFYNTSYS